MVRKLSLLFAGALMGASAMSLVYGAPGSTANAAGSETYKQLAIFGDIFERVRAQYVTPPDEKSLVENAINGMLTSLDPHSSYMNAGSRQGHARPDQGRVRRPRHRSHDGERAGQGDHADRRHARRQGRRARRRLHRRDRRRGSARPDAQRRGREDARPGQHADQAHHPARRRRQADRDHGRARHHQGQGGQVPRRERRRLHEDHLLHREDLRRPRGGDRQDQEAGAGRQAEGLRARPAPQSGRPARPGGQRVRRLPRPRRDRLDPRPRSEGRLALRLAARRRHRRQAADRAGQWRLGQRLGNRRRRAAGSSPRDGRRHARPSARARCRPSSRCRRTARCG